MKKKLTKTISLIVFVMFLQLFIPNVHAASGKVAVTCVYDDKETIVLNITNSGSISKADSCTFCGDIYNWNKADEGGFKGRDYYLENHACPPYVVYDDDADWRFIIGSGCDEVYLAESESNAKKIKKGMTGARLAKLKEQILGEDASEDVKELVGQDENTKKLSLPKTCECKENYDGTNISVKFEVPKNYSSPGNVTINFGGASNPEKIANYSSRYDQWLYGEKSKYYYVKDLVENDKCPDYAIVARRGTTKKSMIEQSYFLLVSDTDNLENLKKDARHFWGGDTYSLPCTEKTPSVQPSSNSNSNKKSNKSNYQDPDVNSNVVRTLAYDVSTYSCGSEYLTGIPARIPKLGKFIMNFLQILIPIVLIIYGSLDLVKAVYASKEDEIKKGQQTFVKRLVSSIIIFFVFAIVKLVISVVSTNSSPIMECVDCILRNSDNCYEED